MIRHFLLTYILCILVILVIVKTTEADFLDSKNINKNSIKVTTFDFSEKNTANESNLTEFFNVSDVKTGGFDVKTLRVKKEGSLGKSLLKIGYKFKLGNAEFCKSLNLRILKNWSEVYSGRVSDLNSDFEIKEKPNEDFIFVLSFPGFLQVKQSCSFDIELNMRSENGYFNDYEKLENFVSNF